MPGDYRDGIYYKSSENSNKQSFPKFIYHFKEMRDSGLYNESFKKIEKHRNSKSFISDDRLVFINPALQFEHIDSLFKIGRPRLNVEALKYYIDTSSYVLTNENDKTIDVDTYLPYEALFTPFYILKTEVTNKEYREFISYVRDSIARMLIFYGSSKIADKYGICDSQRNLVKLKWDEAIPWNSTNEDIKADLQPLYIPEGERFFSSRNIIDTRKLNYKHTVSNQKGEVLFTDIVNIYPDTLRWIYDFNAFTIEPNANYYLWHPAYENYPVVGVTYPQIRAFLHWKTNQLQRELNIKGLKYIIEYDLPNELEWETVNSARRIGKRIQFYNRYSYNDNIFLPNLILNNNSNKKDLELLDLNAQKQTKHTLSAEIDKSNSNNPNTTLNEIIYFTHNNVSEWMRETYFKQLPFTKETYLNNNLRFYNATTLFPYYGNYQEIISVYLKVLSKNTSSFVSQYKSAISVETKNYNQSYRLVRGGNWFDCRALYAGDIMKTFASSDSAHSTLGFRYVIRFKEN